MISISENSQFRSGDPSRKFQWLEHHPIPVMIMALSLNVGTLMLGLPEVRSPETDFLAMTLSLASVILLVSWFSATLAHRRGFCQTCFNQPLGGPQTAKRKVRTLRTFHVVTARPALMLGIALAILVTMLLTSGWVKIAMNFVYFPLLAYELHCSKMHSWLVPWCPWCRGDGGFGEEAITPDPTGTKVTSV